jgi:hypothetical protein
MAPEGRIGGFYGSRMLVLCVRRRFLIPGTGVVPGTGFVESAVLLGRTVGVERS